MPEKSIRQALNEALDGEMARDPSVILLGEDLSEGVMGVTSGLIEKYGKDRVIDTPISETAFIGATIGAAASGLRPVAELMFVDFAGVCFDQILNQMAKLRYMTGGALTAPLVLRTTIGAGERAGAQHSQSLHHLFASIPGLVCVMPSNAYDAKGLLLSAIRSPDPVIFFEHKMLYDQQADVPDEDYEVPLGKARIVRKGRDLTIISLSRMVRFAEQAARTLEQADIDAEIIDPRTIAPLDRDSLLQSVRKTGRLIIVDEGAAHCGMASDIAALAAQYAWDALKAPVRLVTPPHAPIPFSPTLEDAWLPGPNDITAAAIDLMKAVDA